MVTRARTGAAIAGAPSERHRTALVPAEVWVLAGLTVLAAVLRFTTLTDQSYWFDEAQAAHEMTRSFGGMLHLWSVNEPNPPLYFVLAWPWARVFGIGEAGLRSLSAVAGVAVIPLAWLAGRELVSSRAGLVAAALAAVSPFLIWYSQEAREYMLLTALCAASLWLFARARNAPTGGRIACWAVVSALALATQYFAAFLVFGEAVWLLYSTRGSWPSVIAVIALVAVEAALLPHAVQHESHPTGWIDSVGPLSIRLRQVPVIFSLNTLDKSSSSLVNYGLLGAALLAAVVIVLLLIGASGRELRGAGVAASLAGCVVLVPLVLALLGHDYYEARAMIPAWIPLAIVLGAACTVGSVRVPGAILAALLLVSFVWAGIRIDQHAAYQRPNLRGVAALLGHARRTRAIVAYQGSYATAPLALYLPGVKWTGSNQNPQPGPGLLRVSEIDVVGNTAQQVRRRLPAGVRLISRGTVDGYLVARFSLRRPWHLPWWLIAARAPKLVGPAGGAPGAVLVQRPVA